MNDVLTLALIAMFGVAVAVSAVQLRRCRLWTYWGVSGVWIAMIAVSFALAGRDSRLSDVIAATVLLGAFPVFVVFKVGRLSSSNFWISTGLAAASWVVAVFAALSFGLSAGLISK